MKLVDIVAPHEQLMTSKLGTNRSLIFFFRAELDEIWRDGSFFDGMNIVKFQNDS